MILGVPKSWTYDKFTITTAQISEDLRIILGCFVNRVPGHKAYCCIIFPPWFQPNTSTHLPDTSILHAVLTSECMYWLSQILSWYLPIPTSSSDNYNENCKVYSHVYLVFNGLVISFLKPRAKNDGVIRVTERSEKWCSGVGGIVGQSKLCNELT